MKYRNAIDRKLALYARLMLKASLEEDGCGGLIHEWKRDDSNKPGICGWQSFNISHSGKFSVFAYGDSVMGIDLEEKQLLDYHELEHILHDNEKQYVFETSHAMDRFYEIWTKKEALLKATGVGLINELSSLDCTQACVFYADRNWFFYSLPLVEGYAFSVCSDTADETISTGEFDIKLTK
jgi:4'-phosphopantetheinyl transferase